MEELFFYLSPFLGFTTMHFTTASTFLVLLTSITASNIVAKNTEAVANWNLEAYTDGACQHPIATEGGNTPKGSSNLGQQANSYRFASTYDPRSGISFSLLQYAGMNCVGQVGQDEGGSSDCSGRTFESYKVVSRG
jgi:hypothetical protein